MISKTETIKNHCKELKLSALALEFDEIILQAEKDNNSYLELVKTLLETEINHRVERDRLKRMKLAKLPLNYELDEYDYSLNNGLDKKKLNQLRELGWLEQNFNVILMGPSGTGKTYIAAGLCYEAVKQGYRAYFKRMDEIVHILKMKQVTSAAAVEFRRMLKAHLLVIDDIMMFPVTQQDATAFFNLVNLLHENTSMVITTNKSPKQWAEVLNDQVLTTALLDRILYHCEIIKLEGKSYRMANRKTIFEK